MVKRSQPGKIIKQQYFKAFHTPLSPWGYLGAAQSSTASRTSSRSLYSTRWWPHFFMPALSFSPFGPPLKLLFFFFLENPVPSYICYRTRFILPDGQQAKALKCQETEGLLTTQSKQRQNHSQTRLRKTRGLGYL